MTIVRNTFDKKIKDFCDILSFKKYDDKYVGKAGYFSDSMCRFQDLTTCVKSTLTGIDKDIEAGDYIFKTEYGNYRYFLPESLVKPIEKKYRVFSLNEFLERYEIGDTIKYRIKNCEIVEQAMLIGFQSNDYVLLGNRRFGLKELFNNCELNYQNKWQPFGIEVEKK